MNTRQTHTLTPRRGALGALIWLICLLGGVSVAEAGGPVGSYAKSCRKCGVSGPANKQKLSCECKRKNGKWRQSALSLQHCNNREDIGNRDGVLTCAVPFKYTMPPHSYLKTCEDCRVFGDGKLKCKCRKPGGGHRFSELKIGGCADKPQILNKDGRLACPSRVEEKPPFKGSYAKTCRKCETNEGKTRLKCECKDERGAWRWSSLLVRYCKDWRPENKNGVLTCLPRRSGTDRLDTGNYLTEQCQKCKITGPKGTLKCQCKPCKGSCPFYAVSKDTDNCKVRSLTGIVKDGQPKLTCTPRKVETKPTNQMRKRTSGRLRR